MILLDTSAWIAFFRGVQPTSKRVALVLESGEAAICGPIWTELRQGFRTSAERRRVLPLLTACHELEAPEDIWAAAGELGFVLARKGITVKSMDLLIAVCALSNDVALLTTDKDFDHIRRGGVPLMLA